MAGEGVEGKVELERTKHKLKPRLEAILGRTEKTQEVEKEVELEVCFMVSSIG